MYTEQQCVEARIKFLREFPSLASRERVLWSETAQNSLLRYEILVSLFYARLKRLTDPTATLDQIIAERATSLWSRGAHDRLAQERLKRRQATRRACEILESGEIPGVEQYFFSDRNRELACRCGSENVRFFLQQTRSGDEAMTAFYVCLDCEAQWRG